MGGASGSVIEENSVVRSSSAVAVDASDGHVTLQGSVDDRYAKHAIEDSADDCMGVQDVDV